MTAKPIVAATDGSEESLRAVERAPGKPCSTAPRCASCRPRRCPEQPRSSSSPSATRERESPRRPDQVVQALRDADFGTEHHRNPGGLRTQPSPIPGDCDELICYRLGQGDSALDLALAALTRVAELGGSPHRDWASCVTSWRSSPRS
jgi:hypothetical protein